MIVSLSGSTGFVGQALLHQMRLQNWDVRIINRESFHKTESEFLDEYIEGSDAVINLAGAPVSKKWTAAYKKEILESRTMTTRKISLAITQSQRKPAVFISASAIGIYDEVHTHNETSTAFSHSYLASVCQAWEHEAQAAASQTRLVICRTGLVLGSEGGALKKMHLPFSIGLGGRIGNGKQAVSFIHIKDLVRALMFCIENQEIAGVVNAVTPYPTSNVEFSDRLAKVLNQPCWLAIPAFAMRFLYGEGAQLFLEGQKVLPAKLEQAGFRFNFPAIQNALVQIYG